MPYIVTDSHKPFLAGILENPEDMTPRLVYADWLQDQEGLWEHAQWIRNLAGDLPFDIPPKLQTQRFLIEQAQRFLIEDWIPSDFGMVTGSVFANTTYPHKDQEFKVSAIARMHLPRPMPETLLPPEGMDENVAEQIAAYQSGLSSYLNLGGRSIHMVMDFRHGFVEELTVTWEAWMKYFPRFLAVFPLKRVNIAANPYVGERQRRVERDYWRGVHFLINKRHSECWTVTAKAPAWHQEGSQLQDGSFHLLNVPTRETFSGFHFGAEWYRLIGKVRASHPLTWVYPGPDGTFQFHPHDDNQEPVGVTVDPLNVTDEGVEIVDVLLVNQGGVGRVQFANRPRVVDVQPDETWNDPEIDE